MGEEYGEHAPFRFFSDHIDTKIATATRDGRRREFAAFAQFGEQIPDPQAEETFLRSKLTWDIDPVIAALYIELLDARRDMPTGDADAIEFDEDAKWLRVVRGPFELVCNFADRAARIPVSRSGIRISSQPARIEDETLAMEPLSGALLQ
jgi:maltooligosyltrehalose trehalohydrolase